MNQGIIVAILSFVLYLTNLLGGSLGQPMQPATLPLEQQSYVVLGQRGEIVIDGITLRRSPANDGEPSGAVGVGTTVTILDQSSNWYKIRSSMGAEGWIPEYALSIQEIRPKSQETMVLAYYPLGDSSYESLIEYGSTLTGLVPLGWKLDSYGGLQADFDPEEMGRSLYFAGNQEVETYAHLSITRSPSPLLDAPYLQEKSIETLISTLEDWGLKGLLVDVSYVPDQEASQLFHYLETLRKALQGRGMKSMLALPWKNGFDYGQAKEASDYLVLKTDLDYSQQSSGPVASVEKLAEIIPQLTTQVAPEKLILALSTGGLDWPRTGPPTKLSHQEIMELAATKGASIKWDTQAKSPFFNYGSDHEVWFENRYSMKYKFELIKEYKLAGLALLNLGDEDPEIWGTLTKAL